MLHLPFSLPVWAHWLLIVAGGVAAILAAVYLVGVIFGKKYGHNPAHVKTRGRSSVIFAVMALCAILTACSTNTAVDAESPEANSGSNASVDLLSQSGFDYEPGAFAVEYDNTELRTWIEDYFRDYPDRSVEKLKASYSGVCAPINEDARLAACRQAIRQYVDPQSEGLQNPVAFPVTKELLEAYYVSGTWESLSWEEKVKALDEAMHDFVWLILTDAEFCGQGVWELARHEVIVKNNQSWLPEAAATYTDSYLRTDEPIGNAIWFEQDSNGVVLLTDKYVNMAARVARCFVDNFEYYEAGPIQAMPTEHNWWLPHYASANLAHVTDNPSQVCVDSIILVDKYAEPGNGVTIGICLFDQRLQTYDTVEPTIVSLGAPESPATPQEPDTPSNPGTPTTPTTPDNPVKPPDITITVPVEPDNPTPKPPVTVVTKQPSNNVTNQGNGNLGGGDKAVTDDGANEFQVEKVPEKSYPTQGSSENPANTPNTSAGSSTRQETSSTSQSSTTVRSDGKTESSGNGGQDHAVTNPSGGATSGGTPPAKDTNKPNTGTQSVSTTTNNSQSGGSTSQTTKVESTVGETIGTANGGAANKTPLPD